MIDKEKLLKWIGEHTSPRRGLLIAENLTEAITSGKLDPEYEGAVPLVIYEVIAVRKDFLMMQVSLDCYPDKEHAESIAKEIIATGKLPGWFVALPENKSYSRYTDFTAHIKKVTVREADDGIFEHKVEQV